MQGEINKGKDKYMDGAGSHAENTYSAESGRGGTGDEVNKYISLHGEMGVKGWIGDM